MAKQKELTQEQAAKWIHDHWDGLTKEKMAEVIRRYFSKYTPTREIEDQDI